MQLAIEAALLRGLPPLRRFPWMSVVCRVSRVISAVVVMDSSLVGRLSCAVCSGRYVQLLAPGFTTQDARSGLEEAARPMILDYRTK